MKHLEAPTMLIFEVLLAWFLLSLTGALAPGPLTAAVIQNATKGGRTIGILPMVGHAIVELGIVIAIIVSVQSLTFSPVMISGIMVLGGFVVIFFGLLALKSYRYTAADFVDVKDDEAIGTIMSATVQGALVSILSPYFLIWWFAVGLSTVTVLIAQLQIGVGTVLLAGVLVYFTHISTDFIYGVFLSLGTDKARKHSTIGNINWLNVAVGVFQLFLGGWFILRAFF